MIKYKRFARVNLVLMMGALHLLQAGSIMQHPRSGSIPPALELLATQRRSASGPQQFEVGKGFESAALQAEAKPKVEEIEKPPAALAAPAPAPAPPAAASESKPASGDSNKAAASGTTDAKQQDSVAVSPSGAVKTFTFNKQSSFWNKIGTVPKDKLPAKISSAISTGSKVTTHYISTKQAMAERFGAFVQNAVRKMDKRNSQSILVAKPLFANGNQTFIGVGEMFNRLKGVTDNGLARTLGASMKFIMKNKCLGSACNTSAPANRTT